MPRPRHRRDDDRPRRRFDDDDRPRRHRRDDDRPPRRRRLSPAVIVGVGLGAFVVLLGIGLGIYLLARGPTKPAANDLLAYAPSDAVILSGYDVEEISRIEPVRKALE